MHDPIGLQQIILPLLLIAIVLSIVLLYFFYFIRSMVTKDAPYVGTFGSQLHLMEKLHIKTGSSMLDLGCGDGKVLRFFAKKFGCTRCVGYDINLFAIRRGKILNILSGQQHIFLHHARFEQAPLKEFDYIYIYLFSAQVASIEDRVFQNKKSDTVVICNTFACTTHQPFQVLTDGKEKIYLYR